MPTSAEKLLGVVWGNRKGFVFLPSKDALDERYPKGGWNEAKGLPYEGGVPSLDALPAHSDLYFCPVVFSKPLRRKEHALPTNLLWSDLDTATPQSCKLKPSVAWESSPGRYQALWFLDHDIDPNEAAELSKRVAYADGADKGGWDLTQVLRIPGTINYKYPMKPPVSLLWASKSIRYTTSQVMAAYPPLNGNGEHGPESSSGDSAETETSSWPVIPEDHLNTSLSSLPIGIRTRLFASTIGVDRSTELQKLARDILRFGISPDFTLLLLRRSTWNKFAGQSRELVMLRKQVSDAEYVLAQRGKATESSSASQSDGDSPIIEMQTWKWTDFLSIPTKLRWLVEDSWVDGTVGFISGRSKSYKTWMGLDLALSVLSGEPFLGVHPVGRTGPVLLIQEEDPTAILQERLRLIAKAKNMLPSVEITGKRTIRVDWREYPLTIINVQGFDLTSSQKVAQVRRIIGRINPVMVLLDPLINMMGSTDEHRATEVVSLLREIKQWREEFGCNVVVVHHWNKTGTVEGDRGGAHMYGSFANHAWLESALHVEPYIEPDTTHIDTVTVEREFKAAPGTRSQKLKFHIDTVMDFTYMVESLGDSLNATAEKILEIISESDTPVTTGELETITGFSRTTVSTEVNKLVRLGRVVASRGGGRGKSSTYTLKAPN